MQVNLLVIWKLINLFNSPELGLIRNDKPASWRVWIITGGGFAIVIGGRFGIVIGGGFAVVLSGWFGVDYAA